VILDTTGNIFGGFTPVKWESSGDKKADNSQKSFIFTLKNPLKRFALKPEKVHEAIACYEELGPCFGCGYDITIEDNCNTNTTNYTVLGLSYINDTGFL
jgi:hypothetical protein